MGTLIGKPVPRREGRAKLTGSAVYTDDFSLPGMIFGCTVRSPVARGRIREVFFDKKIPWKEFTIVSAADIPGQNQVALILDDQPFLADERINHPEEPVVLLAHPDRYLLEEARKAITFDIEELPAALSIEDSLNLNPLIWGTDNILKSYLMEKGDVDSVWEKAAAIVEGEYFTGAQEQLYIEPNGMVAKATPDSVTIWGSMQCPYYVHKALGKLFTCPEENIRIIQLETGGGFGGKEEYPSILAGHAALLSLKSGRPVKIIYDRAEDMVATTKRHPSRTRHKTAIDKNGKLLAMDIDFVIDGGAYATLSAVVLSRGTIHAAGPYSCPNVRIRARAVATNTPPHGAFRGFGAPQSIFALERHLNKVARQLRIAPEELRARNLLKTGEMTATSQMITEKIDLVGLQTRAMALADFSKKRERYRNENEKSSIKRGIGLATFMHGAGFTGSGEKTLASVVGMEATAEGKVRVLSASTEIGQGTNTVFSQIAAEALGISIEGVEVAQPDTAAVPNSGPTVASRTCMVVGKLVEDAARALKQTLTDSGYLKGSGDEAFSQAVSGYIKKVGALKVFAEYKQPPGINWDDKKYQGDAYGAFAWATYVADVAVDTTTYEVKVEDFVALQEVGTVVHPVLAKGQIEGGVAQGIGYAIYENIVWKGGRMANNRMTNYIMPTAMDLPPIRVFFEENPYPHGAFGAKGIGELPMDGPAPAILNAVEDALGISFNEIPLMPEKIQKEMTR